MDNNIGQGLPSADWQFPAQAQQGQVDAANGRMPAATTMPKVAASKIAAPKANEQHNPVPESLAPQMVSQQGEPPQPPSPPSGAENQAGPAFEDTEEIPPNFEDTDSVGEVPKFEDTAPADNTAMSKYVKGNLEDLAKVEMFPKNTTPVQKHEATSFLEAMEAGLQMSTSGLINRGKMPDVVLPEHATRAYRIANQIGTLAGDMPAMVAGGVFGGLAATPELPVVGTVSGAMAGSFALPAALRKIMIDHYEKGDIKTAGEFSDRLMATTWEAIKGAATGLATEATGGAAAVAGPVAKIGGELAAMTAVGAAVEGQAPSLDNFIDNAIVLGGFHGIGMVKSKLSNIYAATGEKPETITAAANTDPILKQQILSHDLEQPAQATPVELKDVEFPVKEGAEPEINRNQLFPKEDINDYSPPKDPIKMEDRSPEEQEVLSKIGETKEPEPKTFTEKFNSWYAHNVDWTDPLKVAYAAFKDKMGKEVPAEENAYIQARLFAGHTDFVRRVLEEGVPDEDGNFTNMGLNDIYRRVPGNDQAGFDAYSIAKRALELNDNGIVPWKDFNKEGAEKLVASGADKFEDLHQERVAFQNDVKEYGERAGVINSKVLDASMGKHQEYVPFSRIIPEDELTGTADIGSGNGKLMYKIEGSELELKNPRLSIYQSTAAVLRRAEINQIRAAALEGLSYVNEKGELSNDFVREVPIEGMLKSNQLALFRDGNMTALEGTPDVIDSLRRLEGDKSTAGLTLQMAKAMATSVRLGTVIDPGFGFRHFFRSTLMSGVYSQTGQIPFYHAALAAGEFFEGESDNYKNWMSDGGATQSFDKLADDYISNDLQGMDEKVPFINQVWNVVKHPLDATEAFIKMTDNLTRFTEYKRAIEQGNSRDQAAFLAREVTPDFAKVGIERGVLRQIVAFQGAHINSLTRMAQAFKEDPQGTILKMSALSTISAAMWYVNKDDKEIQDLPDYQKDLYWNFNVSRMFDTQNDKGVPYSQQPEGQKQGTIFRLPKPWGPGILFGSGTERTLDAFTKDNPEAIKSYGKALWDSVVPNLMPSALAPIMDQMANKNLFNGRQLVSNQQQKELPEMQYQPYTSETAKQLAKLISYVPMVKDIGPSSDPLASPAVVENYIKGWTGNAGGWILKIGDAGLRAAGVTPSNVGKSSIETLVDKPILSEFLTRFPSMKTQPVEDFYQNLDETSKVMNTIMASEKAGDINRMTSVMAANPDMQLRLDGISKSISYGKKAITMIQDNPTIDPIQKRQLVDGILFQLGSAAKSGNQMMSDFKKQMNQNKSVPGGQ